MGQAGQVSIHLYVHPGPASNRNRTQQIQGRTRYVKRKVGLVREIALRALKVGDGAPSFTLFKEDHVQVTSNDLLREGPLVVSFFRGRW